MFNRDYESSLRVMTHNIGMDTDNDGENRAFPLIRHCQSDLIGVHETLPHQLADLLLHFLLLIGMVLTVTMARIRVNFLLYLLVSVFSNYVIKVHSGFQRRQICLALRDGMQLYHLYAVG
jgi:hypothetical protein